MKILTIISALILFSIAKLSAQTVISAKDAANHIGEKVTVCDRVFRESNKAYSVGLYLGDSTGYYVVVSIRFKRKFQNSIGPDYFHFERRKICVTGIIKKGAVMKVDDPAQIISDTAN
jgi:hypothetical protein